MGVSLRRPQTLNVEAYRLRRILGAVWDTVLVENIRGIGYRLAIGGAAERAYPEPSGLLQPLMAGRARNRRG